MRRVTPFDARGYYYHYAAETRGCRAPTIFGGAAFSPLSLSPHIWLDPSDLTTLFQERTGASATTPSEVDGVVGTMRDKSGNGDHVVAPADGQRPILRNSGSLYWLEFDGSDDRLGGVFAESVSQPYTVMAALQLITDPGASSYLVSGQNYGGTVYSTTTNLNIYAGTILTGPVRPATEADFIATGVYDGNSSEVSIDAGSATSGAAGALAHEGFAIGAEPGGASESNIRFYGAVALPRIISAAEIASLRTYLAAKQGRVL